MAALSNDLKEVVIANRGVHGTVSQTSILCYDRGSGVREVAYVIIHFNTGIIMSPGDVLMINHNITAEHVLGRVQEMPSIASIETLDDWSI